MLFCAAERQSKTLHFVVEALIQLYDSFTAIFSSEIIIGTNQCLRDAIRNRS